MAVIFENVGRLDIAFPRACTYQWGVHWYRTDLERNVQGVDLTAWTLTVELRGPQDELWLSKPVTSKTSDGFAYPIVDAADTAGEAWETRRGGTWRLLAAQPQGDALSVEWSFRQDASTSLLNRTPDLDAGVVKAVAWGYWQLG